jgi:LmbE family N-acetylglucosaminyl deacetylase
MTNENKPCIMFVAAHQDDAEGLAGGLFAKLEKKLNPRGLVACFTDGSVGHYRTEFIKNQEKLIEMRYMVLIIKDYWIMKELCLRMDVWK